MQLTILGTATPYPVVGNACSGYLLTSEAGAASAVSAEFAGSTSITPAGRPGLAAGTSIWIDAGTGTLAELQRHIPLESLDAIFISHRHSDHSADLLVAYYALRFSSLRPQHRIRVIGPEALAERLADFLGPDALQGLNEVFDFTEMSGWGETVIGDLTLAWGPVSHGVPAFALTVTGPASDKTGPASDKAGPASGGTVPSGESVADDSGAGRRTSSFTYSGDTAPCISLVEMAEASAVLLCEVGYSREALGEAAVHHTAEDAGRTATQAGVGTIILTHIADDLDPAEALRLATAQFSGTTLLAEPGRVFDI